MSEKLENKRLQLLIDAGIKNGEWQYLSKATLRAVVGDPRTQLHMKVYLVGLLHTQGYAIARRQKSHPDDLFEVELAIKLHRGRAVPFSMWDLGDEIVECTREYYQRAGRELKDEEAEKARPSRQNLRRALELVEEAGYGLRATFEKAPRPLWSLSLAERQKMAGNGKLLLYFYVTPRPARVLPEVVNFGYFDGCNQLETNDLPKEVAAIWEKIQRMVSPVQLSLFTRSVLEDLRAKYDVLAEAEEALRKLRREFKAAVTSYLPDPQSSQGAPHAALEAGKTPVADLQPRPEVPVAPISTNGHTNGARRPPASSEIVSRPRRKGADLSALAKGLREAAGWKGAPGIEPPVVDTTDRSLQRLFGQCRDEAPDCTPEEVRDMCLEILALYRGKKLELPYMMLLTAVPPRFEGETFQAWRRKRAESEELRKPPEKVVSCPSCAGSGLVGCPDWKTIPDAVEAVKHGASYCSCQEGAVAHDLVAPLLMRDAS